MEKQAPNAVSGFWASVDGPLKSHLHGLTGGCALMAVDFYIIFFHILMARPNGRHCGCYTLVIA